MIWERRSRLQWSNNKKIDNFFWVLSRLHNQCRKSKKMTKRRRLSIILYSLDYYLLYISCFSLWQCNANHFFVQRVPLMIWEICVHKYLSILSLISLCSVFIWFIMIFNSIHPVTHEGWWHRVVCVTQHGHVKISPTLV